MKKLDYTIFNPKKELIRYIENEIKYGNGRKLLFTRGEMRYILGLLRRAK